MKGTFYLIILSLFLSGCVTVQQDYLDIQSYNLAVSRPLKTASGEDLIRLKVNQFKINAPYDRKQFVYQLQTQLFENDYYNRWDRPLNHIVTDIVFDWFSASGQVQEVIGAKSLKKYDYVLSGQVKHFYADFSDPAQYAVVIELFLTLQSNFIFPQEVFSQTFTARVPIKEKSIPDILQGYNQGLEQILKDLETKIIGP